MRLPWCIDALTFLSRSAFRLGRSFQLREFGRICAFSARSWMLSDRSRERDSGPLPIYSQFRLLGEYGLAALIALR